jgi:hypothetical protein
MLSHWTRILSAAIFVSLLPEAGMAGVAQWDLNGNLASSNGGTALVGGAAAPEAAADISFTSDSINGADGQVAGFTRGTFFRLTHGLPPNGGGTRLNRYTLLMDVKFPDRSPSGGWAALLQTTSGNTDDADWAINPAGGVGINGNYGGVIQDGEWYRLALVIDNVNHRLTSYIDGVQVQQTTGGALVVDGRFSLGAEALLFADDTQENSAGLINSVELLDFPLTSPEVEELGTASAAGIPIPDHTCPRNLACSADVLAKTVHLSWSAGDNLNAASYEILRDGIQVTTVPLTATSYTDTVPGGGVYNYELGLSGGNAAQCANLPLQCRVQFPTGDVFFSDDFEGYLDDVELVNLGGWLPVDENNPLEDATWTITNPGGRLNPPTADGTPSSGQFLISDSDRANNENTPGSGMSHDILSPIFSCVTSSVVWLHFDCSAQLNNNGLCVFDVDVSSDRGANWTNVFRRVAPSRTLPPAADTTNADGFVGRLHLDISAQAGKKPEVMFRLRHFEPNDDWWIAMDNVVVDNKPWKGGEVNVLGPERFNTGIPAGWTVRSDSDPPNTGLATWNTQDPCKRSVLKVGGKFPYLDGRAIGRLDDFFAIMDDPCTPSPKDDYLITPPQDLTNADEVFLEYKSEIIDDNQAVADVLLSLDGGATFETPPLFSYNAGGLFASGEDPFYAERIIPVPVAAGKKQVAFAFHYQSPGNRSYWALDDIKVTANGAQLPRRNCNNREFQVDKFDATTGSVTCHWKPISGDGGFRVLANGGVISANLPASTLSYTDTQPPAGGSITYSLQSLVGGAVDFTCAAPPVSVFACPHDFGCCVDQTAKTVKLSWVNGLNLAGTGYRITRDGVPVRTVPLTQSSFLDNTLPGPGAYEYELILNGGDPTQCPGLPLKCHAVVVGGDAIFSDDFECYRSDADLAAAGWEIHEENNPSENAAWTVTNPGNRANPPLADGSPSQGRFLVSDSDAANGDDHQGSGRSHDIWSPSFDCRGQSAVWLHMDCTAMLNNNGEVVFDVDVSSDDGVTWENVFRRVAPGRAVDPLPLADIPEDLPGGPQVGNADAFFGTLDLDLSTQAAQKPGVRFRLRQFEPSDDWWIAVDDVLVDNHAAAGGTRTLLPVEGFTNGIPGDWTVDPPDSSGGWRTDDPCNISLLHSNGGVFPDGLDGRRMHHLDDSFALVAGDEFCGSVIQDEMLSTPVIDCSSATQVYLHFKSDMLATDAVVEVLLSLDRGNNYDHDHPVFSDQRGGGLLRNANNAEAVYNAYILKVPQAAGQSEVVFGFHYVNPAPQNSYWAIDDVKVTGDGAAAGPGFVRGDCNQDKTLDLTDAIVNLNYQFLGGATPACLEACNTNGDAADDLTDAVYLLNYLFLGGPKPPAPGPDKCEKDPEPGPLSCQTPSC